MTTKTTFENEIAKAIGKSKLTGKEKELEDAFLEILGNKRLHNLAKSPNVKKETYEIFYSSDNDPYSFNNSSISSEYEKKYIHPIKCYIKESPYTEWIIGLVKDALGDEKLKSLTKEYGKEIKNEFGILGIDYDNYRGSGYSNNNYEATGVYVISMSVYKKNPNKIRDIIKFLAKKEIYSVTKRYDIEKEDIEEEDIEYLGKGLNKKRLQEIVIENWVKPLSYFQG